MTVRQQLSQKPVAADPAVIAEFLNRELVPVARSMRAHINGSLYAQTFGDGVANTFTIQHSLGTMDVMVQIYDTGTGDDATLGFVAFGYIRRIDVSTVELGAPSTPGVDQFRVLVRA